MIKKTISVLGISASFFAAAQDVSTIQNIHSVYGEHLPATAKFNAMAGAHGALGGDVSSLSSNPAGLGVAITSDLSATLLIQNSNDTSTLFGTARDYKVKNTGIGHVGAVASFDVGNRSAWKFVNLGLAFSTKSVEDYSEVSANNSISFDLPAADPADSDVVSFNRHAYDRVGTVSKTSLGVGGNYDNRFYIGGSVNIHSSAIDQSDTAEMTYASDGQSESFTKQYTPYSENGAGFSANVGIIGKINNQFRIGASVETPTWWQIDRSYTYYDVNNADNDGVYSEVRKLQTPLKATVSAAFVPSKNFALNADYTIGLTKPKYKGEDSGIQAEFDNLYNEAGKSMSEVKVGAEYRIAGFRLRGGYGFATSPFNSSSVSALGNSNTAVQTAYSDLYAGKKTTIGAGIGYDFRSFYIDAAYNRIQHDYSSPFLRGSAEAGTEYYSPNAYFANANPVVSNVKNLQNNVSVTVGWKF